LFGRAPLRAREADETTICAKYDKDAHVFLCTAHLNPAPLEMDPRGVTKIQNPQKKGHCLPDKDSHGLVLPTYSRLLCCGGVSSGKSMTAACVVGQCHAWIPFDKVFLMSPNNEECSKGEWGLIDLECLDSFPTMEWWSKQPPRCCLILDDISWSLSKKGGSGKSQAALADRTMGFLASHHGGNQKRAFQNRDSCLTV
jgi:hypothetical protein